MAMMVRKRDGKLEPFDQQKVAQSIKNASKYVSNEYLYDKLNLLVNAIRVNLKQKYPIADSWEIAQEVMETLQQSGYEFVANSYLGYYRVQHFKRATNTTDDPILSLINYTNTDVIDENSNKDAMLASTQRDLLAGEVSKDTVKRRLLPPHIVHAHDEGVIHIHDLDYMIQPIHNCMLVNLEDMLDNGTVINDKMVESPKSFVTACTIATQIMAQVASNQYGGQSITIKHLAKYLYKSYQKYYNMAINELYMCDEDTEEFANVMMLKELKDGVQTIRYQLSTLQTTNGQAPFATIYLEIEIGHPYERQMALIVEEMLKQRMEGMKNYRGQEIGEAFPKLVYLLDEHNCLEGGKYDYLTKMSAKCSAKRLVPDYQSAKMLRKNYGDTFPPMGCRSHLSPWRDKNDNLKWYGRFNQGVVSLNLPQVGIVSKGDKKLFWDILEQRTELCREALLIRHNLLKGTLSDTSPIHWQFGASARLNKGEKIDKLLMDGYSTLSLGYVGFYELSEVMLGVSHTTKEGEAFVMEVMQFLKDKCDKWKSETGLGFSLYGTPAENLIYRFANIDKQRFGIIENVTDKGYYTNSYHVDVREEIDAFSKLQFESKFHDISLGGCISYIEVPDLNRNLEAMEQIINFIYHNIQYAEVNTKSDLCYKCGFDGEIKLDEQLNWYCPACGNKDKKEMQVIRRTCGYIGSNFWNKGRTKEIKERVLHL